MVHENNYEIMFAEGNNTKTPFCMHLNETNSKETNDTVPEHLRFNENSLTVVLVYCALFVVAAIGNLTVFISLFRSRHRKSRISLMIRHLALADLLVTFIMIPLEVGWRVTVQWLAGNFACKTFLFLRAFGLYLSSNVLVCVSLDRYFAVLHPLKVNDARRRGKMMLACAWGVSLVYSVPQSIVFHVSTHPDYPSFSQCVTYGFFTSKTQEIVYNLFCVIAMYFIPLLVIVVAYTAIMCEISKKSRETKDANFQSSSGRMRLRRSDMSNIERARSRTLRMTITIVLVFIWCWTPYVVMLLWYVFDKESASKLPNWLQDALFMMAVSNSCMNPLVYGSYAMNFRKECSKCFCCLSDKTTPVLTRKSTDVEVMLAVSAAAVEQPGFARRLIKCVLRFKQGSIATRSTMLHGVVGNGNPTSNSQTSKKSVQQPKKCLMGRPISIGFIFQYTEPPQKSTTSSYRGSFHSDPYPCTTFPSPPPCGHAYSYQNQGHLASPQGQYQGQHLPLTHWSTQILDTKI